MISSHYETQDVFPIRFYGIHILNEPLVFKIIISMLWPLLSTKIRSRVGADFNCCNKILTLYFC